MEQYVVVNSKRKIMRDMKSAIGDDILRFIAELLTNSDDSYKRINNFVGEKKIIIRVEKDKRNKKNDDDDYMITIIDNAEGMSKESLHRIFATYGGDNAGGIHKKTRGIFGQGASDVLRAAAFEKKTAQIISIKDNKVTKLLYNMDDKLASQISLEDITNKNIDYIRQKFGITGNGTAISFGVPSTVKFNKKVREKLAESIEKYPSFRYLLNQNDMNVSFEMDGNVKKLSSVNYQFEKENEISNEQFEFLYEGKCVKCNLTFYKNENKKDDGTNIIVRDENYNVFDNTMFGQQNNPSARNISGELEIVGLYKLCWEHLNSENPEAIVRDNRTGFETKCEFYDILSQNIDSRLMAVLDKVGQRIETTNLGNNKKFNDALKNLNKYLKTELKDEIYGGNVKGITPPPEGIKFARGTATITKGKEYNLKLYINSSKVSYNDKIIIDVNGDEIEVSPLEIEYLPNEIKDGLVIKNITIKAIDFTKNPIKIQAKVKEYLANILVEVVEDEIHYPECGLEFFPKEQTLVYNVAHKLKLYIDTNIIPLRSRLEIIADGLEIKNRIITFDESDLLNEDIAMVNVEFEGGEQGNDYEVIAKYVDLISIAKIILVEPTKNENLGGGLIAGFKLQPNETMDYQAYFNPRDHYIYINTMNPINLKILGDMKDLNPENPAFKKEQIKYLCDIIANQSASLLVKQKNVRNGEINFEDFEDAVEKVQNLIQTQKNIIYNKLYEALI